MKRIFGIVFALALCAPVQHAFAAGKAPALDGKTFSGTVGDDSDKKGDPDNFVFDKGQFRSTACDQYGYTAAPYTATKDKNGVHFQSTTKNKSGDTIVWNGTIKGHNIDGQAVRKPAQGKEVKMWFKGNNKKEKETT